MPLPLAREPCKAAYRMACITVSPSEPLAAVTIAPNTSSNSLTSVRIRSNSSRCNLASDADLVDLQVAVIAMTLSSWWWSGGQGAVIAPFRRLPLNRSGAGVTSLLP